jgi:hypothetical protein
MKFNLIAVAALVLATTACAPKGEVCLADGERGRILDMQQTPPSEQQGHGYVTILLTTDNKTVRVCRALATDLNLIKKGQVISGYRDRPELKWPYLNWYRIG